MYKYIWCEQCQKEVKVPLTFWEDQFKGLNNMFRWKELLGTMIFCGFWTLALGWKGFVIWLVLDFMYHLGGGAIFGN